MSELVKDHSSINRQIDFIDIPLMPELERLQIIKRAEYKVDSAIIFDDEAMNEI